MKKTILALSFMYLGILGYSQDTSIISKINFNSIQEFDTKTFDLFYQDHWFEDDEEVKASIWCNKDSVIRYNDQEIVYLMELIPTGFPLSYNNIIKQQIEHFSQHRRQTIAESLGLGQFYFPYFEEVLAKYKIPLALKYLPVIESNMNNFAGSSQGATGMWQFMIRTGQHFGLDVTDYFDERRDPYLATEAAAKYLSELYEIYGDWLLVLAAYNAGPGNVNKAIGLAGGKTNFWEIRPFLPRETQNYIPKFTACLFVMHYHDNFEILARKPSDELFLTEKFLVKDKASIKYICELTGMDSTYMQFVNPALTKGIIPKFEKGFEINVPLNYLGHFSAIESFLANDPYVTNVKVESVEVKATPSYTTYKVKSGDTLGQIAARNNTTVSSIKKWNKLYSDRLSIGQKLKIYK